MKIRMKKKIKSNAAELSRFIFHFFALHNWQRQSQYNLTQPCDTAINSACTWFHMQHSLKFFILFLVAERALRRTSQKRYFALHFTPKPTPTPIHRGRKAFNQVFLCSFFILLSFLLSEISSFHLYFSVFEMPHGNECDNDDDGNGGGDGNSGGGG